MKRQKIDVIAHFKKKKKNLIRSEDGGEIFYLKCFDEDSPIQFWKRDVTRIVSDLNEINRIETLHVIDDYLGRVKVEHPTPLYEEILEQIPKSLFKRVKAFEVLIKNARRNDTHDFITTILYG